MLPKLHGNFTCHCFASQGTDRSKKLRIKQDMTGLRIRQMSRHCDLWCGKNCHLFLFFFSFYPRSHMGFGNHTLTGTVGDQWIRIHDWYKSFLCFNGFAFVAYFRSFMRMGTNKRPCVLSQCGLVATHGDIHPGHHWFRWWFVAWQHQAIARTNVN